MITQYACRARECWDPQGCRMSGMCRRVENLRDWERAFDKAMAEKHPGFDYQEKRVSDQNGNAKHAGKQFAIVQAMWSYGGRDFCVIDGQIYQRASDNTWQVVWRVGAPTYSRVQGRDGQWYAINTSDPNDVRLLEDDPDEKSSPH